MKAHWNYLVYVLRHKYFVFLECLKLGVPVWIAILHDWDKFLPDEWFPYVNYFYNPDGTKKQRRTSTGYYKPTDTGDSKFDHAWFLHQKRNKHHWQYWCLPEDIEGLKILPIPELWRREMLADWRGAGRAQGTPDTTAWFKENRHKLQLHPETRKWLADILTPPKFKVGDIVDGEADNAEFPQLTIVKVINEGDSLDPRYVVTHPDMHPCTFYEYELTLHQD